MAEIKGFTIKGITKFKGHEGEPCSQGNLYINGKKVGYYSDSFTMGEPEIEFDSKEAEKEAERIWQEYYAEHPDEKWFEDIDADLNEFISKVFTLIDHESAYKKMVKKGFPVLLVHEEQPGYENIIGCKAVEYAKKKIESDNKKGRYITYTQSSDFIIK